MRTSTLSTTATSFAEPGGGYGAGGLGGVGVAGHGARGEVSVQGSGAGGLGCGWRHGRLHLVCTPAADSASESRAIFPRAQERPAGRFVCSQGNARVSQRRGQARRDAGSAAVAAATDGVRVTFVAKGTPSHGFSFFGGRLITYTIKRGSSSSLLNSNTKI